MGLFKRLTGFLGFARDEVAEAEAAAEDNSDVNRTSSSSTAAAAAAGAAPFAGAAQAANRRGFGVPVQVPVDRGPLLVYCSAGDGGVQGLRWFAKRLRIDEDGDVADEFLDEVIPDKSVSEEEDHEPVPRFQVKYSTRPAKVRNQALSHDGKLLHCVEYQGRLEWV